MSTLAHQLQTIHQNHLESLDKKKKVTSLLFNPSEAADQDLDSIFALANNGFLELLQIEPKFERFSKTLFSEKSKYIDRFTQTKSENDSLDKCIDTFLSLLAPYFLLRPSIKVLEWLIRRFKIHKKNQNSLLLSIFPYHMHPFFMKILSIIDIPLPTWSFLIPFKNQKTCPTHYIIAKSLSESKILFSIFMDYVQCKAKEKRDYQTLLKFWATCITEAIYIMREKSINEEIVLSKTLPNVFEGLLLPSSSEYQIANYIIITAISTCYSLSEKSLIIALTLVSKTLNETTINSGLICLAQLAQTREGHKPLPDSVFKSISKLENINEELIMIGEKYRSDKLIVGYVLCLLENKIKDNDFSLFEELELFLSKARFSKNEFKVIIHNIFLQVIQSENLPIETKNRISNIIKKFKDDPLFRPIFEDISETFKNNITKIQDILQITIVPASISKNIITKHRNLIKKETTKTIKEEVSALINAIQNITHDLFFINSSQVFHKAFSMACKHPTGIDILFSCPTLQTTFSKLYFLSQIWVSQNSNGDNIEKITITALKQYQMLITNEQEKNIDYQFFIPYLLISLNNKSINVRKITSEIIHLLAHKVEELPDTESIIYGFSDNIYGNKSSKLNWLSKKNQKKLLIETLIPNMEECIFDNNYIYKIFNDFFELNDKKENTSFKLSILEFICSHVISCPFEDVWFRLLKIINNSSKESILKTKLLLPILNNYQKLNIQGKNKSLIIKELFKIVVKGENGPGTKLMLEIIKSNHIEFAIEACQRLSELWKHIKHNIMFDICKTFIDVSEDRNKPISSIIYKTLNNFEIPVEVFLSLFSSLNLKKLLLSLLTKQQKDINPSNEKIEKELQYITVFLELLEKNNPETKPQLISPLFTSLNFLITLETNTRISMAYPEQMILTCLQKIINNISPSFNSKAIRMDLLINCIYSSPTPQIHNHTLLLIATIAKVAPELILHNIMPVFTFMGTNILYQDNDFSTYVIEQTIQKIIPPLISNTKNLNDDIVINSSTILTSFVNAFTYIPDHRRLKLFIILIKTLDPDKFLYAFLVLFLNMKFNYEKKKKNIEVETITDFCISLSTSFEIETQLLSFWKLLDFTQSLTINTSNISNNHVLIDTSEFNDKKLSNLRSQLIRIVGDVFASKQFKTIFVTMRKTMTNDGNILSTIHKIIEALIKMKEVYIVSENKGNLLFSIKLLLKLVYENSLQYVLKETLILLPLKSFTIIIKKLLISENLKLRLNACIILKNKIETESKNINTESAAIELLPNIINNMFKENSQLACVGLDCINIIAQKYGENNPTIFFQILDDIIENGLKNQNKDIQILSIICIKITSVYLGPRLVPKLPNFIPYILKTVKESNDDILEITIYSLIEKLINSIPSFMSSYTKLILESWFYKNSTENKELNIIKESLKNTVAKHLPLKMIFLSISKYWEHIAIIFQLDLLNVTLKNSKKEEVEKISLQLFNFFLTIFDLKEENKSNTEIIISIKEKTIEIFLQMIMKLNDTTFRPLFLNFRQWAFYDLYYEKTKIDPKPRLLIFYKFFGMFLERFKSIVTNYFSHVLDDTIELLQKEKDGTFSLKSDLWEAIMNSIYQNLLHDTEEFWQDSTRFSKMVPVLISHLSFAPQYKMEKYLIPSIAQLAAITVSDEHYKTINTLILTHMNSDNTLVHLAVLETQKELYTRLKEEWLVTLPQTIPFILEAMENQNEKIEYSVQKLIITIESYLGESLQRFLT
ncbi:hypothetical protein PMAC_000065 [Pneumocystis sp. 'macacae']|nr:hypothetical protein PMAC_000065 [Pneumocystis sp. 'macacae']